MLRRARRYSTYTKNAFPGRGQNKDATMNKPNYRGTSDSRAHHGAGLAPASRKIRTDAALLVKRVRVEREIEYAVGALSKLSDGTLRQLGIPHRSLIEETVRFCHEC